MKGDPAPLDALRDMDRAIGAEETSRKAMAEIQPKFALASRALPGGMSQAGLRARMEEQARARFPRTEMLSLIASAGTCRDVSGADLTAYARRWSYRRCGRSSRS